MRTKLLRMNGKYILSKEEQIRKTVYKIQVKNLKRQRPLEKPNYRLDDNIKMDLEVASISYPTFTLGSSFVCLGV